MVSFSKRVQSQIILLLVPFFIFVVPSTDARRWNSQEIAIGEWDVTLHGSWRFDPSEIFPEILSSSSLTSSSNSSNSSSSQGKTIEIPKWRGWGKRLDCSLSICSDGTFVLTPQQTTATKTTTKSRQRNSDRLPVRGQWKVLSNPYCVTDRFYDQLTLESYPRVEMSKTKKGNLPLRSIELALSCRMWGRHSSSSQSGSWLQQKQQKQQQQGRMTHGTLVCKQSKPNQEQQQHQQQEQQERRLPLLLQRPWKMLGQRPILASFSALRSSLEPTHEGWEDAQYFGY